MRRVLSRAVLIAGLVAVCGCSRVENTSIGSSPELSMPSTIATLDRPEDSTLAYEHAVTVEVPSERLLERLEAVRSACAADRANACTILDVSRSESGGVPSGRLVARLAPAGVDPLVAAASEAGKILSATTHAEDLAQPVADADRRIAELGVYRERLDGFMRRKDMGVADLLTVSKELATVQTELDQLARQRATLQRRIDTDLLTIELQPPLTDVLASSSRVGDAFRSFFSNMADSFASLLEFLAFFLPWLPIAVLGFLGLRWLWIWSGRWLRRGSGA